MTVPLAPSRPTALTPDQRRIAEWGDGPLVVIAGAGTGKTRVIVERVRWLLETKGSLEAGGSQGEASETGPFEGPLMPEQILVLTYNVKAAKELGDRIEAAIGLNAKSRLPVSNFHSFCHRVLTESSAHAGLPAQPDVLDGIGQILLLRDIRPDLPLIYHSGGSNPNFWLDQFVGFINRAKDELVTPNDFDGFVDRERAAFEARNGSYEQALERLQAQGNFGPSKAVRGAYASFRSRQRADEDGTAAPGDRAADFEEVEKAADREARRTVSGDGRATARGRFSPEHQVQIDQLAATYVVDGAALDVLRLSELAAVYRAYQDELERRGALDFGEQISAVTKLFKRRPNVLRRYQRQYRYILVDEFQDANIAQIELIDLLGRSPDRPDNVMVVGDDDQSIYRFRGASFAAFVEFDRRFSAPPRHDPTAAAPGTPPRLRLEENFRSIDEVLTTANRLIEQNQLRYAPDKVLRGARGAGVPVELVVAGDTEEEAREIVDRIKRWSGWDAGRDQAQAAAATPRWSEFAVLYRKHRHREPIIARLRDEGIPYTVVGGLSLFETPEIRDLEQSLRTIADSNQDVALVRMMSSAPWRLDALEILQISRMANYDRRRIIDVAREVVESGQVAVDKVRPTDEEVRVDPAAGELGAADAGAGDAGEGGGGLALQPAPLDIRAPTEAPAAQARETRRVHLASVTRAKLRRLLATISELAPRTWRDGPFTILEEYVAKTGVVFDLLGLDTLDAKRTVANIANFMRFAQDWQAEHPEGTLAGFVSYLDAYQNAGGELPTSVEATDDREGVQLMTLYQAKGLEFENVFVPQLLVGEWPAREYGSGLFPKELLKEAVPQGDIHLEEERRLLYVALTRAKDRLVISTLAGPGVENQPSQFLTDISFGAGTELSVIDRAAGIAGVAVDEDGTPPKESDGEGETTTPARRGAALPTDRERRLALRSEAGELLDLLEGISPSDPEAEGARADIAGRLAGLANRASVAADEARTRGLDPLTLRVLSVDNVAGANLLDVAALPKTFSYSQVDVYERCPLQFAFRHVYRIPSSRTAAAMSFGSTAHAAFEAFTKERRERQARGEPAPTRDDLQRFFDAEWKPGEFGERTAEDTYKRKVRTLLDNFWTGELESIGEAIQEEAAFQLAIDVPGDEPATFTGMIDRIDRLPSGGIEVIDYKTGRISSQKDVQSSLQLSIYALACRDALGLGTPENVTLYFTESQTRMSTTRTDDELDAAREQLVEWVRKARAGAFLATPSASTCWRCDYGPVCPSRVR